MKFSTAGQVQAQWDVRGRADGVTGDPNLDAVIVTVNEDANSALYVIHPSGSGGTMTKYSYSAPPTHNGGTDAITFVDGTILVSASAPGTTGGPSVPNATHPALYSVALNAGTKVATLTPYFNDEDTATVANVNAPTFGQSINLALTDPDSTSLVPENSPRFHGDFMLTSQGDLQQIFADVTHGHSHLVVLNLAQSIDDAAWATHSSGTLFSTDASNNSIDAVNGDFHSGTVYVVATPCNANAAPATCPAPGFAANYLASENLFTGALTPLATTGVPFSPKGGLLFVGDHDGDGSGHGSHWAHHQSHLAPRGATG